MQAQTIWAAPTGEPDSEGRQPFTTFWHGYIPGVGDGLRAQCSRGVLEDTRRRHQERGNRFLILPTEGLAQEAAEQGRTL